MEDDDHGRKSRRRSCGRHCEQARRLMRVSTKRLDENTSDYGDSSDRPTKGLPQPEEVSNTNKKDKNKNSGEAGEPCDDEYMLQNLHKLKRFIQRVWNFAWCYTQYCYPGLRTAEYYRKVKRVCQEKEKAKKNEKKAKKKENKKKDGKKDNQKLEHSHKEVEPTYLSAGAVHAPVFSDSSTQTSDEDDWSNLLDDSNHDDDTSDYRRRPTAKPMKHLVKPLKILPSLEEDLGWGPYLIKHFRKLSRAVSNFMSDTDQEHQIGAVIRILCIILAPAVMWLGVKYIFLKRQYKSLSGKLRRIKEENDVLKKESGKLEMKLSSTEKLKMPFASEESKQQVVAEFTRLAESRMKSKKKITRLSTEKQALLEELKMAKKLRDEARSQYISLTQRALERGTHNLPFVQT